MEFKRLSIGRYVYGGSKESYKEDMVSCKKKISDGEMRHVNFHDEDFYDHYYKR